MKNMVVSATLVLFVLSMHAAAQERGPRDPAPAAQPKAPSPRLADGRIDISGIWTYGGAAVGVRNEPAPYQDKAAARQREFSERRNIDDPMGRCLLVGVPRITTMPMPFKIIQLPTEVILVYEAFHAARIIPTDGRGHPDDMEEGFMGDSVGKWEGDTLVVDVVGFNDRTWLGYGATHHSDALHVTERFTRRDIDTMGYEVTMEDGKVFTKPWTVRSTLNRAPNERIREYECIDNNQVK